MDIYADRFEGFFFSWVILLPPKLGSNHTLEYPCKVHTHIRPRPGSQTNIFGFFFFPVKSRKRISAAEQVLLFSPVRLMAHFVCFSFQQKNALAINHLTRD